MPVNKIRLDNHIHNELHNTQDLPWKRVRKYRMKVNGILIPNDYVFDAKQDLWQEFFDGAIVWVKAQEQSIINQINLNKTMLGDSIPAIQWDLKELVAQLIGTEKDLVNRQLKL